MANEQEQFKELRGHIDPAVRKVLLETPDGDIDEELVRATYDKMCRGLIPLYADMLGISLTDEEVGEFKELLIDQYLKELAVNKPSGFAYKNKECIPWVREVEDPDWYYWERYERYLIDEKGWERKVVKTMSEDTLNVLDLMADPRPSSKTHGADRRGLVVADVQSGKTSNYIGLMSRAADMGYRVIIVLAGIYNVLRSQTQIRIEEGFVGFDSTNNSPIGVGLISNTKRGWRCGSSRTLDFGKKWLQPLMVSGGRDDKWVFVIKKNRSVMESLIQWLQTHPEIRGPLLLIDDEADNASINVKYAKEEVSAINGLIRRLLKQFDVSSYVGYTATPFANILIDPKAETDDEGEDIFPRSFIYTLEASSTYFGSSQVFDDIDDETKNPKHIRYIEDIDPILPSKHKKGRPVTCLPESLKEAMRTFILASVIRALRGDAYAHTTMMINVSPYQNVQAQVAELVKEYLRTLKVAARSYALLPDALDNDSLKDLCETLHREFGSEASWSQVSETIYDVLKRIDVATINSSSGDSLNYEAPNVEHVIAVGGYRLSRGLTLEGLLVSYYSRNSRAYDTLMQMARWFGYRPGYQDLCRVWMSREAASWYAFVADATVELIGQLRDMRRLNSDPSMYGLMVRQCPKSLTITARNKIGVGQTEKHPFNLNGSFIETTALYRDKSIVQSNFDCARALINRLLGLKVHALPNTGKSVGFTGVEPEEIRHFISEYKCVEGITGQPQGRTVLASIDRLEAHLTGRDGWDVVVINGGDKNASEDIGDQTIYYEGRFPGNGTDRNVARVGNKSRLSSRDVEAFGLSKEVRDGIDATYKKATGKTNTPGVSYRKERERPLLVIHFVRLRYRVDTEKGRKTYEGLVKDGQVRDWGSPEHHELNVGWSISYPVIDDPSLLQFDYLLNGPALAEYTAEEYDEDDQDA